MSGEGLTFRGVDKSVCDDVVMRVFSLASDHFQNKQGAGYIGQVRRFRNIRLVRRLGRYNYFRSIFVFASSRTG